MRARLAVVLVLASTGVVRADVAVLTMTPGPRLVERFGHTALRVGQRVYNFGTFSGTDPEMVRKFLGRHVEYWLSTQSVEAHYDQYDNRVITEQVLELDADEERELAARLEENARPENRAYLYDFFLNNCATRPRDVIDRAVGGALAAAGARPGHATWRQHVERVLDGPPVLPSAVSLLLNASTDEPTTRWQEAFLPRELQALLDETVRGDGRKLVKATHVRVGPALNQGSAAGVAAAHALDVALLLLLALPVPLALVARRRRRALLGGGLVAGGIVGGLLGVLVLTTAFTPYPCARGNASVLLLHPLLLAMVPAGIAVLLGRQGSRVVGFARIVALAGLVVALCDLVAHGLGFAHQRHLELLLIVAAWNAAAWLGLRRAG